MKTKEQIHDELIAPLVQQILDICEKHRIAFVMDFLVPNEKGENLHCTSCLLEDDCHPDDMQFGAMLYLHPDAPQNQRRARR